MHKKMDISPMRRFTLPHQRLFTNKVQSPTTHFTRKKSQLSSHSITCRHSSLLHAGVLRAHNAIAVLVLLCVVLVLCALLVALRLVPVVPVCHLSLSWQQHALSDPSSKEPAHMAERSTKHSNC
jgi:hypothetical protein